MMDDDDKTTTMNGDDSDECSALDITRHRTRPDQVRSLATATAQVSFTSQKANTSKYSKCKNTFNRGEE